MTAFPLLTICDPPGTSEDSLDPLGLYQVADRLAVQFAGAVRAEAWGSRERPSVAYGVPLADFGRKHPFSGGDS